MKKLFLTIGLILSLGFLYGQSLSVTNKYEYVSSVDVVQTIDFAEMINVVSSAGAPVTNSSLWATWIPVYINNNIYTNGLTTNNVSSARVEWTDPKNKATYQARYIHQGMPDMWDGVHYIKVPLASERILAGQRLHVWLLISDPSVDLSGSTDTNIVYNATGIIKKVIVIPTSKPVGY
jgi:hypothetical protein